MCIVYTGLAVPPPPLIGGGFPGIPVKKAVIPNVPLPMLNWIPIKTPDHTVFKASWLHYVHTALLCKLLVELDMRVLYV